MSKVGKISVISKDYTGKDTFPTMEKSLRESGMSRAPGTFRILFPYKELNGKHRTGLDEYASSVTRIEDLKDRDIEQRRVKQLRKELEDATGMDLGPNSPYYNHNSKGGHHVEGVKLVDGDNIFNLDDPWQSITFYWLSAHPGIASSLEAYNAGKYPSDTQYYVNDDNVESGIQYRKKKTANEAIIRFDSWSLEKRRKIARLLYLPVTEDTKEEAVYNLMDNFLKSEQVAYGAYKGRDPIKVFSLYADVKDDMLYIKDIVHQAFTNGIYKERRGGRVYEGELEVFKDRDELTEHLLAPENQDHLFDLEKKLKVKKMATV